MSGNFREYIQRGSHLTKNQGVWSEDYNTTDLKAFEKRVEELFPDMFNHDFPQSVISTASNPKLYSDPEYAEDVKNEIFTNQLLYFWEFSPSFWGKKIPEVTKLTKAQIINQDYSFKGRDRSREEIVSLLASHGDDWRNAVNSKDALIDPLKEYDNLVYKKSSGSTSDNPIIMPMSPLDYLMTIKMGVPYYENRGLDMTDSDVLFFGYPELVDHSAFMSLARQIYTHMGGNVTFAMDYAPKDSDVFKNARNMYGAGIPNNERIGAFMRSGKNKFMVGGNFSFQQMALSMEKRIAEGEEVRPIKSKLIIGGGSKNPMIWSAELLRKNFVENPKLYIKSEGVNVINAYGDTLRKIQSVASDDDRFFVNPLEDLVFRKPGAVGLVKQGEGLEMIVNDYSTSVLGTTVPGDKVTIVRDSEGNLIITEIGRMKKQEMIYGCFN